MLNFLKPKPPSELKEALKHIHAANEIIMAHKRNKHYTPSDKDLSLITDIEHAFQHGVSSTGYVHRCLTQRKNGEPEGAKKFTDKEAFDWHYPK